MKIYFVRHGQIQHNKEGRIPGQIDAPLNEVGIEEAKATAKELSNDFDLIYSSDLIRCKQTAEIINDELNLNIIFDARLRERNLGSLEGTFWKDMDPVLYERDHNSMQYNYHSIGGESVDDIKKRVLSFISEVKNKQKDKKVLVVTHGGIIRILHFILHGKVPEKIHNASVHEFDFPDN